MPKSNEEMIEAFLLKNKITVCEDINDDEYIDYRRTKQTYNQLHTTKIVNFVKIFG